MRKNLAVVVALALGLLAMAALARGLTGWAQEPGGSGLGGPVESSANLPDSIKFAGPPDRPAEIGAQDIEAAATYNASLRIAGSTLSPRDNNVVWRSSGSGGCIYSESGNALTVYNVPVSLPQGATVKYLRLYYNDTNVSTNSSAWFTAYDSNGGIASEWAASSTGSAGAGYGTSVEFTHTVNYESYSYAINWRPFDLGTDMQLCGFRIYYHTPPGYSYLPLTIKGE